MDCSDLNENPNVPGLLRTRDSRQPHDEIADRAAILACRSLNPGQLCSCRKTVRRSVAPSARSTRGPHSRARRRRAGAGGSAAEQPGPARAAAGHASTTRRAVACPGRQIRSGSGNGDPASNLIESLEAQGRASGLTHPTGGSRAIGIPRCMSSAHGSCVLASSCCSSVSATGTDPREFRSKPRRPDRR